MKFTLTTLFILLLAISTFAQRPSEINVIQTDPNIPAGVVASSTVTVDYNARRAVNADTTGRGWGTGATNGGGWNSGDSERYLTSTYTATLSRPYLLTEIVTYGLRDDWQSTVREPAEGEVSFHSNKNFQVFVSENCSTYTQVGAVTGNNLVINHFPLSPPLMVKCIRLNFDNSANFNGYTRLIELKGWADQ